MFRDGTSNNRDLFCESLELTSAIESCCRNGHADVLRLILDKSSSYQFSVFPSFGQSLVCAISNGHDKVVDVLLLAGMDVNAMTCDGETALSAAIFAGKEDDN